eukprot:gene12389-16510_t
MSDNISLSPGLFPWVCPDCDSITDEDVLNKLHPVFIFNSLTRTKIRFIPRSINTPIAWYQCGPTVYSESHIGHARTYIGLDIIRRILKDYFGYNIIVCQNVTDIDDKIINKSNDLNIPYLDVAGKYE